MPLYMILILQMLWDVSHQDCSYDMTVYKQQRNMRNDSQPTHCDITNVTIIKGLENWK